MSKFRSFPDRRQLTMLPPSVDGYVADDDVVRFVDALVDAMDLTAIERKYSEKGRPAYSPRVMVKLLVYGRMEGVRSSRALARRARRDLNFIYLASTERPDFRTLSNFRKQHAEELGGLLRETVRIGCREGFIDLEQVAVDGTILRANAASRSFRTPEKLEKELAKLDLSFEKDVALDEQEDERFGDDDDERKLSGSLKDRKALREKIQAALDEHRATPKRAKKPKQVSTTDPEARFIKSKGTLPSYNGQAAVDATSRMVVAGYATNAVGDAGELPRILEQIETNTRGRNPKVLAADRGYSGLEGLKELKERGIEGFIPQHADRSDVFPLARFTYVEEVDAYRCPNDKLLHRLQYNRRRRRTSYVCRDCAGCSLVTQCIAGGDRNRTLSVSDYVGLKIAMQEKMRDGAAKKKSAVLRSSTVETIFGHLKANRGLRQFLLRGKRRVSADWRLELAVVNIERLVALFKLREEAIASG